MFSVFNKSHINMQFFNAMHKNKWLFLKNLKFILTNTIKMKLPFFNVTFVCILRWCRHLSISCWYCFIRCSWATRSVKLAPLLIPGFTGWFLWYMLNQSLKLSMASRKALIHRYSLTVLSMSAGSSSVVWNTMTNISQVLFLLSEAKLIYVSMYLNFTHKSMLEIYKWMNQFTYSFLIVFVILPKIVL